MKEHSAGMVVAPQPEAVDAGAEVLLAGGNAVDAAIVAGLVQGVVDPQMCGVAGFGSLQILETGGRHRFIDFHARAPAAIPVDVWAGSLVGEARDGFGFHVHNHANILGHQAVAVPSVLRAFERAISDHGSLGWADVVEPAAIYAEEGFRVRPYTWTYWSIREDMGRPDHVEPLRYSPAGRAMYFNDGQLVSPGTLIRNPDLAGALRRIGREGSGVLHGGEFAEVIEADMAVNGGFVTANDLAQAEAEVLEPLWGSYRGYRIATNHPPGGGVMLIEMLNMLESFDLAGMDHNGPTYIATVAEVMKRATIDKDRHLGDPRFVDVPVERLTDKSYALEHADAIRRGERVSVPRLGEMPSDTTHLSVVDRHGTCVTMTHSLGSPSGVIPPGLGFMLNGCMSVFDPRPGRVGSIAPGKARFSSIAPTIVFKGDEPYMVVGAHGGTQIAMALLQTIVNVIDFGMTMQEAVSAPRFSATSDLIDVVNRIPRRVTKALEEAGHQVLRSHLSYGFGTPHGILLDERGLSGGSDPSRDGYAQLVTV